MFNIGQVVKQVQDMQAKMAKMQEQVGTLSCEGQAGNGLVRATLGGRGDLKSIKIDPSLLKPEDVEILEDMVLAAVASAKTQIDEIVAKETEKAMGGVKLPPGLSLPF